MYLLKRRRLNMGKSKTSSFIVELELKPTNEDKHQIDKRIRVAIGLYNTALNYSLKRLKAVLAEKEYRLLLKEESTTERNQRLRKIEKSYGYSEYQVQAMLVPSRKHFKAYIGSLETRNLATRAFRAVERLHYHKAKKVYFKKYNTDDFSIEGKTNSSGIKFRNNKIIWFGLEIPVIMDKNNDYIVEALKSRTKYVRLCRKLIRGRYRYYAQLVQEGYPPQKDRYYGSDKFVVGLDIGPSSLAIASDDYVDLISLKNPRCDAYQREIRRLQRAMDRSRRTNNPNNYNDDKTVKKGSKVWINSNNYLRLQHRLNKLYRKLRVNRKNSHEKLANIILMLGLDVRVEDLNIQAWQKRAKKTSKNKNNGKNNSKKRFGKSINNNAPAMLLTIIDRKLSYKGHNLKKIDTKACKASQYNHIDDTYVKKPLSQRTANVGGHIIQRDIYSAFLIKNTNKTLDKISRSKCNKDWNNFLNRYEYYKLTA